MMIRGIAFVAIIFLFIALGAFLENEYSWPPAAWALFGAVFGSLATGIALWREDHE